MLNRQNKLSLAALAVMTAFSGSVLAQGIAQLPAGPQKTAPVAPQVAQRGAPSNASVVQGAPSSEAAAPKEDPKPRNPLEEISRLNSEIGSLKAKLQIADIKSQIKKKEDEMNPPAPKVVEKEKREEAPKVSKKDESKPNLPPLPNLNSLLNPSSSQGGGAVQQQGQVVSQQGQSSAKPATKMDPQVLAIEGFGDDLKAELITDWGGWAVVTVGDKYYDWKVDEIKVSGVVLTKGATRMQVAMTNSKVNKLQMQAMLSRSMPQGGLNGMGGGAMGGLNGGMMGAPVMSPGGFGATMPTDGGMMPGGMPNASPVIPNAMGGGSNSLFAEAVRPPIGALPGAPLLLGGPPTKSPF